MIYFIYWWYVQNWRDLHKGRKEGRKEEKNFLRLYSRHYLILLLIMRMLLPSHAEQPRRTRAPLQNFNKILRMMSAELTASDSLLSMTIFSIWRTFARASHANNSRAYSMTNWRYFVSSPHTEAGCAVSSSPGTYASPRRAGVGARARVHLSRRNEWNFFTSHTVAFDYTRRHNIRFVRLPSNNFPAPIKISLAQLADACCTWLTKFVNYVPKLSFIEIPSR